MTTKETLLKKLEEVTTLLKSENCNLSEKKINKIEQHLTEALFILNLSEREEFMSSKLLDVFPVTYLAKWLWYKDIITVEDLVQKTRSEILSIRNIGEKTMIPLEQWMKENNLSFREF